MEHGNELWDVRPEDLPEDVRETVQLAGETMGGAVNLFLVLANNPGLFRSYTRFGARLLKRSAFGTIEREVVIVRTAWRCGCTYELAHHRRIAREIGMRHRDLASLEDEDMAGLSPALALLATATDELVMQHRVSDTTWSELRSSMSTEQIVEFPILVGTYVMLAGLLNSAGVPLEPNTR